MASNSNEMKVNATEEDVMFKPIPLEKREHWLSPAMVFAGLEFSIAVLMVGGSLIGNFGFKGMLPVVLFNFIFINWIGK